ncbi:RNA polymerase sigma-70 factor (ECF subfamily) [Pedobacter africanus]|uniref:RNA polymerase sigma-70 factor (ECF subfamily) n=1 Tax=Pedobacter africanus TaxID=151894 RepID=A0ACC6KUJ1_9SPHI|nr:sigma-70 family RNA polymerase sigma factor [Pedobacter africanus]MDR6782820.1 RNA polymerase sigma-70 factor (ECF subfamily) [Pedobacter africanus]
MCTELDFNFFLLVKSDKHRAFKLVFEAYWHALYKQAYKRVQCADMAKDLVQDSFLSLWNKIDLLDSEGSVLAYLYAVLRNKILKLYEKDEVRARYAISVSALETPSDLHAQNTLIEKELKALIEKEVASMPPRMREIYLLKKEEELSVKQIAVNLSLSEQTIKNQLQTAYQRLRVRVKDYNPVLEPNELFLKKK